MAFPAVWMLSFTMLTILVVTSQKNVYSSPNQMHHHMNIEDLRTIFQVEQHSEVPDYEIVHLHSVNKREVSNESPNKTFPGDLNYNKEKKFNLKAFGKRHQLSLQPLNSQLFKGNLKMWSAESDGNGSISYSELPDTYVGEPYQDMENQAALLLHKDAIDGSILMEGTIGHDLVIKPLPAHIRKKLNNLNRTPSPSPSSGNNAAGMEYSADSNDGDEMFMDKEMRLGQDEVSKDGFPIGNANDDGQSKVPHQHVVYRRDSNDANKDGMKHGDFAFMEAGDIGKNERFTLYSSKSGRKKRSIVKREAPYTIYPEILVIVDYDGYRMHGGDNVQVKRYFVSFWNGVDLRYKLLKGPKVRISIAGLIISRGRDATPYLERNRVGRDAVDSAAALTDMGKYLFRERRLPVYDIAVAVTKLDMCRKHYQNDACNKGTAGFAYVGGACVVNKRLEKVNSVAIIEDTGGFSGIIVAAHEVGHLLGAVHDGSPPPTYLGGPGAEKCRWEDGYIMSDLRHSEKGFKWSPCSVSSFHHFLNGDTATCLYNSPHEDESLPRVLPGKLLTLDAQCRRDRGTSACFKDERVCSQLFCFDSGSGYCVAYRPAAEGSPCGDSQSCSNGLCIPEHENIIPDYSQNTPSYIRRQDGAELSYTQSKSLNGNTPKRSEWEEFWKSVTVPLNVYNPNILVQSTTISNAYDIISKNIEKTVHKTKNNIFDFENPAMEKAAGAKGQYGESNECVDKTISIPGAISCYDYLTRYGFHHCTDQFIKKNCCAAVKYLCNKVSL